MKNIFNYIYLIVISFGFTFHLNAEVITRWSPTRYPTQVENIIKASAQKGIPPVNMAVTKNDWFSMRYLVEKGAIINGRANGKIKYLKDNYPTPLEIAIEAKNISLIDYLLQHGANPHLKRRIRISLAGSELTTFMSTAVFEAIRMNNIVILSMLVKHGADLNAVCLTDYQLEPKFTLTPLEAALLLSDGESSDVVEFLTTLGR